MFGRPENRSRAESAYERGQPSYSEYDHPGRVAAADPEKDDEVLNQVQARAEDQRKWYEAQKRREQEEK